MQRSYSCTAWHSENSAVQLYAPRRPRIMHVEFFVKIPTEIYPCMIHAHKMASRVEGIVRQSLQAWHKPPIHVAACLLLRRARFALPNRVGG